MRERTVTAKYLRSRSLAGFTLLEVIIVIAILVIITVVAIRPFTAFRDTARLDAAAESALSLLIEARSNTTSSINASQYGVHFETSRMALFKGITYSASDPTNDIVELPSGTEISAISLQGGGSDVVFQRIIGATSQYGTVMFRVAANPTETRIVTILAGGSVRLGTAPSVPTAGLVGYWPLSEGSGTVAGDLSGNGNQGTLVNMEGADWVAGKIGQALEFNAGGAMDEYISVPGSVSLDVTGDLTVALWVRPSVNSTSFHSSWNFFIYQRDPLKYEIGYYNTNGPRFKPYNQSGTNFDFSPDLALSAGTWYHITMVRRGTSLEIYLGGILVNSRNDFSGTLRSSTEVRIGGNGDSGGVWGAIDDVRIYSRALTSGEIGVLAGM